MQAKKLRLMKVKNGKTRPFQDTESEAEVRLEHRSPCHQSLPFLPSDYAHAMGIGLSDFPYFMGIWAFIFHRSLIFTIFPMTGLD